MLGTTLNLAITLILLDEAAQIIICDGRQTLSNMVCAMNLSGSVTSTKVLDEESLQESEDQENIVSDKAKQIAERLCVKSGLKQVMLSLNIAPEAVQLMGHDMKLGLMLEKKIMEVVKGSQPSTEK
ncbi:hypothetical protein FGO68_gene7716 [Halteria grandinella]|uniref:Uncharacterized protein n=1 Tax=Halteria grandinella TaxID=5974 RepID=A0A8J8NX55_HALGN|nr:hypothetical protein FGO68_gene7716 [Halteria grandinella]